MKYNYMNYMVQKQKKKKFKACDQAKSEVSKLQEWPIQEHGL